MAIKSFGDLWADLGAIDELELNHVMTKLFALYEEKLQRDPGDAAALQFFQHLENAIGQATECNLNRR